MDNENLPSLADLPATTKDLAQAYYEAGVEHGYRLGYGAAEAQHQAPATSAEFIRRASTPGQVSTALDLPRLLGNRKTVRDIVEQAMLPENLSEQSVIVMTSRVASVSASCADELVKQLLQDRNAEEILLVGASLHFEERLRDAISQRQLRGTLRRATAREAGL